MIEEVAAVDAQTLALYDEIIDVRSPAEFAEDRLPDAINLPVLNNAQRTEIGAIYVRESRFLARQQGAALIARNIATHLETALKDKRPRYRPLLYCWRGGQRSQSMATILSQIGWRVGVLEGGYRTWRRDVVRELIESTAPLRIILLDGQTGAAKTQIINRLPGLGVQILDLEALAAHKGSVFGAAAATSQPSQKLFESRLWAALRALDPSRPTVVEAESNHIGRRTIPKRLWRAMAAAPRLVVRADAAVRARYLIDAYADFIATPGALSEAIDKLAPFHAKERISQWRTLAETKEHAKLAEALMRDHYDPLYGRSRKRRAGKPLGEIHLDGLGTDDLEAAANAIKALIAA